MPEFWLTSLSYSRVMYLPGTASRAKGTFELTISKVDLVCCYTLNKLKWNRVDPLTISTDASFPSVYTHAST